MQSSTGEFLHKMTRTNGPVTTLIAFHEAGLICAWTRVFGRAVANDQRKTPIYSAIPTVEGDLPTVTADPAFVVAYAFVLPYDVSGNREHDHRDDFKAVAIDRDIQRDRKFQFCS